MANDFKQYQEEEYTFSEEEQSDPFQFSESPDLSASKSTKNSSVSAKDSMLKIWRKNLIIGIGLFVVVFLVYKVVSIFFQPEDVRQISKIPATIQASSKISVQPKSVTVSNLPINSSENRTSLHQTVDNYNHSRAGELRFAKLDKTTQDMRDEINNLQSSTQTLQASMDAINTQLSQLNTTLAVLADKIQTQENRWTQSQKKAKPKVLIPPKVVVKRDIYYVLAIVPGRAWLKAADGATITVGAGTEIPGYGKVVKIDPQLGYVTTDSGSIIQYAPSDL